MWVRARFVGAVAACEDEAIVAVGKGGEDVAEHHLDAIAELHRFHFDDEGQVLDFFRIFGVEGAVGFVYLGSKVGEAFVKGAVHEAAAVEGHTIEDEVFELVGPVAQSVVDELAIKKGAGVEELVDLREGKVKILDPVVVISSVDQICYLFTPVFGEIHEASNAVRLLTHVVVLLL